MRAFGCGRDLATAFALAEQGEKQPSMNRRAARNIVLLVLLWLTPVTPVSHAADAAFPAAQAILSTDFSTADVKSYTNGEAISLKGDPVAVMRANIGVVGGGLGHWCADPDADNFRVQVTETGGKRAVELAGGAVSKTLPENLARKHNLKIEGSVVFTPLPSQERTDFYIILTNGGWFTTGPSNIAVLTLTSSLALKFQGGNVPEKLNAGTKYRVDFSADFTDPKQHTWQFSLYEGDNTAKPLFVSGKLPTRNPTEPPTFFALHQVARVTGSSPLVRIHQIKLSSPD
jgi:hypothetical protein